MNTSLTSVSYSPQEQAIATGSCVGKNNPPFVPCPLSENIQALL